MRKQPAPSRRDIDPASVKLRTELFTKQVLPHKGMIYDIAIRFSREKRHIEDNYSDIMVALFKYIESYNPQRDIKSWIYTIATRLIFDNNQKYGRITINHNKEVEQLPEDVASSGVSYSHLSPENYREHYNDDILAALDAIPIIHREALILQQSGYKITEIVEIAFQNGTLHSKSAETIKSRIYHAKRSMQQLITCEGVKRKEDE